MAVEDQSVNPVRQYELARLDPNLPPRPELYYRGRQLNRYYQVAALLDMATEAAISGTPYKPKSPEIWFERQSGSPNMTRFNIYLAEGTKPFSFRYTPSDLFWNKESFKEENVALRTPKDFNGRILSVEDAYSYLMAEDPEAVTRIVVIDSGKIELERLRKLIVIGAYDARKLPKQEKPVEVKASKNLEPGGGACPDCGTPLVHEEGCNKCFRCGFSESPVIDPSLKNVRDDEGFWDPKNI